MSSPPTSGTSTKVAQISKQHRRFNLRSFRSSPRKTALPLPEQTEPYEVAPGILNTDATAIVFGYIDREKHQKVEQKRTKKTKRTESTRRIKARPRSPVKKAYERFKEVHTDDGTDEFRNHTHRKHVEAGVRALQEKRDDSYRIWKKSQDRSKRGRMVSEDDRLQSRGANPRTGIVTPYVVSNGSSVDSGYGSDYLRVRPHQGPTINQGSWRQDEKGWSLVEDSGLVSQVPLQTAQTHALGNVDNSGVDNPAQNPMAGERILRYQHSIRKVHQDKNGNREWLDPNEPPSPGRWTPEGPSSSVSRFRKIPRKVVGSGVGHREQSSDTIVINEQVRAVSVPQLQKHPRQRQRVRIVTPTRNVPNLTSATNLSHSHIHASRSFLGHHPGMSPNSHLSQWAASAGGDPQADQEEAVQMWSSCPDQIVMPHHRQNPLRNQENLPGHVQFVMPVGRPPQLPAPKSPRHAPMCLKQSPHNSQERTYHNPSNIWYTYNAERAHTRAIAVVPITTTTTTTTSPDKSVPICPALTLRPRPQRQDGLNPVPQLNIGGEHLKLYKQNLPRDTKKEHAIATTTRRDNPDIMNQRHDQCYQQRCEEPTEYQKLSLPNRRDIIKEPSTELQDGFPPLTDKTTTNYRGETYNGWVVPDSMTTPVHRPISSDQENHNAQAVMWAQEQTTKPTVELDAKPLHQVTRAGNANTDSGAGPPSQPRSRTGESINDGELDTDRNEELWIAKCKDDKRKHGGMALPNCGGKWYRPTAKKRQGTVSGIADEGSNLSDDMRRTDSLKRRMAEAKSLYSGFEFRTHPRIAIDYALRTVVIMVHHVLMTLSPSSRALAVLWGYEDPEKGEYWTAWSAVLWALAYVLLLTSLLLIAGRMLKFLLRVGRLLLRPMRMIWMIGRWCLIG